MSGKHLFALHTSALPTPIAAGSSLHLPNEELWRRLTQVLRLEEGESVILFDDAVAVEVTLTTGKKNVVVGRVTRAHPVQARAPELHLLVGLTKREAFEHILYSAAQFGVTRITPLLTERIHRPWFTASLLSRLESIMVAGCEQAKQFARPRLDLPIPLAQAATPHAGHTLLAEPAGAPLLSTLHLLADAPAAVRVFIGPEGGFSTVEENLLKGLHHTAVALGPSILRTQDAVQLLVGAVRSLNV